MATYLGQLRAGDSVDQAPEDAVAQILPKGSPPTPSPPPLPGGSVARRFASVAGADAASWDAGVWRYAVRDAPAGGCCYPDARTSADRLAALLGSAPPVPSAVHGWVVYFQGPHSYTTVTWQTGDGTKYQIEWHDNPAAAVAMARTLAVVSAPTTATSH